MDQFIKSRSTLTQPPNHQMAITDRPICFQMLATVTSIPSATHLNPTRQTITASLGQPYGLSRTRFV